MIIPFPSRIFRQLIECFPQEIKKEKGQTDVYWRESLWNFTESLGVNFGVMMLVLLDLTNVLVSVITNKDSGICVCVCVCV